MTLTVGWWLGTQLGLAVLSAVVMVLVIFSCLMGWVLASALHLVPPGSRPWIPSRYFEAGWIVLILSSLVSLFLTIAGESAARFDAIAGRMSGDDRPERSMPPPDDPAPESEAQETPSDDALPALADSSFLS